MKTLSTLLTMIMAMLIAFLPLAAEAKSHQGHKGHNKGGPPAGAVARSAPKAHKAPSRPKAPMAKAPSRAPKGRIAPHRSPVVSHQRSNPKAKSHQPKPQIVQRPHSPGRSPVVHRPIAQGNKGARPGSASAQARPKHPGSVVAAGGHHPTPGAVGRPSHDRQPPKNPIVAKPQGEKHSPSIARGHDGKPLPKFGAAARPRPDVDRRPPRNDSAEERQNRAAREQQRDRVTHDRKRQIAQQHERHRDQVERFRKDRQLRLAAVQARRQSLRATRADARRDYVREARHDIREYWRDRAEEVRDRLEDRRDHLFDDDWWEQRHWRNRVVHVSSPWWWWRPASFASVNVFLGADWSEPLAYDYGTDVIYDRSEVYVRGEPVGTPVEYSRRVTELANPEAAAVAAAPVEESEWTPLGVWALVQEDQGDAVMFFQLSVDKKGMIGGAYANVVSGEELPVVGQVDRQTQRAAWHIGDQTGKVFEAGLSNLTQDQASCLVHVAPGEMQPWLLVRMKDPELPDQPQKLTLAD